MASPVDLIQQKIRDILKSNGITAEVSEVQVNDAGLRGQGMVSETQHITVTFDKKENVEPLNLFAKVHTDNESQVEMVAEIRAFEKEAKFYMEYIPAAKEFCKAKGQSDLIDFLPKCYYGDNDMIIFENLTVDKGYSMADKNQLQGIEEARVALSSLAKHHAISYVLIKDQGGADKFFKRFQSLNFEPYITERVQNMIEPMFENGVEMCIKLLQKNHVDGKDEAIASLTSLKGKTYSMLLECLNVNQPDDILLLNHGDYWSNNMMFLKDPTTKEIKGHMALDFQVTRYGSPALDLGFYIFTSVNADIRRAHLNDLLNMYLDVLKTTTFSLGYPIDMDFEKLFRVFRRKFKLGFCFGLAVSTGPGYAALNEYKTEEFGDMSNWAGYYDTLMQKWIENNPEKGIAMAENIVKIMRDEYHQLAL